MQKTTTAAKPSGVPRGISEMMMRSDAPAALGSSLERQVLSMYRAAQGAFRRYCVVGDVPDLREVQSLRLDTTDELEALGERDPYPRGKFAEKSAKWKVEKFGKILDITKEMRLNDDTRAVFQLASQYGRIAARKEAQIAPALLEALPVTSDADGVINGALNETMIERMFQVFWDRETADGKKIEVDPALLVFHPTRRVSLSTLFRPSTAGDYNPISGFLPGSGLVEERYLTDTTRLYLMAAPTDHPTFEVDFLRSRIDPREDYTAGPRIFADSLQPLSFMPGDIGIAGEGFGYDSIAYKVTHFLGGANVDPDNLGIVVADITA